MGMRNSPRRDAPEHQTGQPMPAVRAHDDEIAALVFGGLDNRLVSLRIGIVNGLDSMPAALKTSADFASSFCADFSIVCS